MPPTPIITALSVALLDVGRHLNVNRQIPIGAAFLKTELDGLAVRFTLNSLVLRPSDPVENLLKWFDLQFAGGELVAGYLLEDASRLLAQLPGAECSSGVRALIGHGPQGVVSLPTKCAERVPCFQEACAEADICTSSIDPVGRFARWVRADVEDIELETQIDVIATFRLLLDQLTIQHSVERTIRCVDRRRHEDAVETSEGRRRTGSRHAAHRPSQNSR